MTYHAADGVKDGKMIKLKAKAANGNICKEKLPVFGNNLHESCLLMLPKKCLAFPDHYGWFATTKGNQNLKA